MLNTVFGKIPKKHRESHKMPSRATRGPRV